MAGGMDLINMFAGILGGDLWILLFICKYYYKHALKKIKFHLIWLLSNFLGYNYLGFWSKYFIWALGFYVCDTYATFF
jgi:hypothetical protein